MYSNDNCTNETILAVDNDSDFYEVSESDIIEKKESDGTNIIVSTVEPEAKIIESKVFNFIKISLILIPILYVLPVFWDKLKSVFYIIPISIISNIVIIITYPDILSIYKTKYKFSVCSLFLTFSLFIIPYYCYNYFYDTKLNTIEFMVVICGIILTIIKLQNTVDLVLYNI